MKLKDFSFLLIILLFCVNKLFAQKIELKVLDSETNNPLELVNVFENKTKFLGFTDVNGELIIKISEKQEVISFQLLGYKTKQLTLDKSKRYYTVKMDSLLEELSEVILNIKKRENYELTQLKPVEGTHIYAGKKTEVINLDLVTGSKATNNARQVFAKVAGLNIYDNGDGGLQLNIGGRGLDPNRTANFNTRQNDYDISADVLGYPESYYTPPTEALEKIQVIRGAASLQYGTQFGGLVNFKLKKPTKNKVFNFVTRNTVGSFGLLSNYTSIDGTHEKLSYYLYTNLKKGDGFRENSGFDSRNFYGYIAYDFNKKTSLSIEATNFYYLAQQAGGLSDVQFLDNPRQSYRNRNWFAVDWQLYNTKLKHSFTDKTKLSLSLFALKAKRKAIGFRVQYADFDELPRENENIFNINSDEQDFRGNYEFARDLLVGTFKNYGFETRLLHEYTLGKQNSFFLLGAKYYKANNTSQQGAGSKGTDADFTFKNDETWYYPNQNKFKYPNQNVSVFSENVFNVSNTLSITPGIRFEHIDTQSKGSFFDVNSKFDGKENLIFDDDNRQLVRNFVLMGIGIAYKPSEKVDVYLNASENYRSVTFSDIRTVNPSFIVDENIADETGYTFDLGIRGNFDKKLSYDLSVFSLYYNNRIGQYLNERAQWVRSNIGTALITGVESLLQWNIKETFLKNNKDLKLNVFSNISITQSEYLKSDRNNVVGNKVEFIPEFNLKTGVNFGYRNFLTALQYSYTAEQFTDVSNSEYNPQNNLFIEGAIPSYNILDLSMSYKFSKNFKLETGINNLLDNSYFTRRATGYPGPGIIPAQPRYYYATLEIKI